MAICEANGKSSTCTKQLLDEVDRVRTGPGKPGKSWNFIMAFSKTGKSWKKVTGPGKVWKVWKSFNSNKI